MFLCLFVGAGSNGAAAKVPKGLDGDEALEEGGDGAHVRFERRRQREAKRDRGGKRKSPKGKEWILKKKEVSNTHTINESIQFLYPISPFRFFHLRYPFFFPREI